MQAIIPKERIKNSINKATVKILDFLLYKFPDIMKEKISAFSFNNYQHEIYNLLTERPDAESFNHWYLNNEPKFNQYGRFIWELGKEINAANNPNLQAAHSSWLHITLNGGITNKVKTKIYLTVEPMSMFNIRNLNNVLKKIVDAGVKCEIKLAVEFDAVYKRIDNFVLHGDLAYIIHAARMLKHELSKDGVIFQDEFIGVDAPNTSFNMFIAKTAVEYIRHIMTNAPKNYPDKIKQKIIEIFSPDSSFVQVVLDALLK